MNALKTPLLLNRRHFAALSAAAVGSVLLARPSLSQAAETAGQYVEGRDFVALKQNAPVAAPAGKIEVVEFFWYGCGHCNAFEPMLEAWAAKLPADVAFRRVPVAFREKPFRVHQRIYFALEQLGLVNSMQAKVFNAIHNDGQKLETPEECKAWAVKQGIDGTKFLEAFNSFTTQTRLGQAQQLLDAYKIDGVPALGIQGRFYTSASLTGDQAGMLKVTDALVASLRKK